MISNKITLFSHIPCIIIVNVSGKKKIIAINTLMHNCNKICIIEKKHCRAKEKKNPKKKIKIKSARFIILKSTLKKTTNLQKHRSAALFSGINDKISLSVV